MRFDLFSQPSLHVGWCLFNSDVFKVGAAFATVGVLVKVVPSLVKLPPCPPIPSGKPASPYLQYSASRTLAMRTGILSILGSLAAAALWVFMYASLDAKTCDIDSKKPVPGAPMLWLYALTLVTIGLFAVHWFASVDAKRRLDSLTT